MAIVNASNLLVYRNYPSAVKQKTRITIKYSSPLNTAGTIKILNTADGSGNNVAELETAVSANDGGTLLIQIKNTLVANGYTGPVGATTDGAYRYMDFENTFAGELTNDLSLANGTSTIDAGVTSVAILTEGEAATTNPVAHSTNASLTINRALRDVTTKDSAGKSESLQGLTSFEITTEALQDFSADLDFRDFFNNIGTGESVTLKFAVRDTGTSNDQYYQGSFFITSLELNAGTEENLTYTATFNGSAALTSGTE